MHEITLTELAIYPVKSFAQVPLRRSAIELFGLRHDRRWMVVDAAGKFVTQRQQARMCLIQPQITDSGLRLTAPQKVEINVPKPETGDKREVIVWNDQCAALDCGDDAATWISEFLNIDCRLVYFPPGEVRTVDPTYAQAGDRTAFSDGFPLLLISQASLDDLNSRLESPISMRRFRPNLVVQGCDAFAEDGWRLLRVGNITLRVVKPCSRCVIPNIDPLTGERGNEPTRTLISYRKRDNKVIFGQNVIADGQGELKVGMRVELIA